MTLLELVNRVLRRLREDEVTELTTDPYTTLVAEFVADAHRETVEAHDWSQMDADVAATVTAGVSEVDLASGSAALIYPDYTTSQSLVRYVNDVPVAFWYPTSGDLSTGTNGTRLYQMAPDDQTVAFRGRNSVSAQPCAFSLLPKPDGDGLILSWDVIPSDDGVVLVRFHTPEALIDVDTDVAREIYAPNAPILARAIYYALNERGEEMGEPGNVAERRAVDSLAAAIETDRIRSMRANTYEMYRD